MSSIDILLSDSRFTMDELRQEREALMVKRMELIERHRKLSNRILIKPFLSTACPPTPPPIEKLQSYDTSWVNSIITSLVYDAVREVEICRPYREKAIFYTALSKDYEHLVNTLISKSIKQDIISELFDTLWNDIMAREIKIIVRQCIGDVNIAESMASTLILLAITKANTSFNASVPNIANEYDMTKSLMMEFCLERNKKKSERYFHKLHLQLLHVKNELYVQEEDATGPISREATDVVLDGESLSAIQTFDIQSLDKLYLPYKFEEYSVNEVWLWKNIKINLLSLTQNSTILAMTVSPSLKFAAVAVKNYLLILKCDDDDIIFKTSIENKYGDCINIAWFQNEQEVVTTSTLGIVCFWRFFNQSRTVTSTPSRSTKTTKAVSAINSMFLTWSFTGKDLRLSQGPFAQEDADQNIKHIPTQTCVAPLFTAWGDQPIFFVVCENNEILRVCKQIDYEVLIPADMPTFDEVKNLGDCGLKFDICKGHNFKIYNLIFKDEYIFYSFDVNCCIIEWEYSRTNFDAYGYVIPKKYVIEGNGIDYVRLVKGVQNLFNTKEAKTRQEALQAAKSAEKLFADMGFGKKAISTRENNESGLAEKTFVNSMNDMYEYDVKGVVVVRKILGNSLFSMKSRMFKLKNCTPTKLLGVSISPCNSLVAYCFMFTEPLYGVVPFLSILLLRARDLSFLNNRIKIPLTKELVDSIQNDEESFALCLSPPHFLSRSSYLIIKINKSALIVSTATSNIVRTTLDIQSYSSDSKNFFNEKNIASIQGSEMKCALWKNNLLIYGSASKQVLTVNLVPPDLKEDEDHVSYYQNCSKFTSLCRSLDPDCRRLLVKSQYCWGNNHQSQFEKEETIKYLKGIVKTLASGTSV